jgi:hypothetical protein
LVGLAIIAPALMEGSKLLPSFKNGLSKSEILKKIRELKSLNKTLNPEEYLNKEFINQHLQKFKKKSSYLVTGDTYNDWIKGREMIGRPDGQFISTASDIDEILKKANGDIAIIEAELGIEPGTWKNKNGIFRVDINNPEELNLRMSNGSESGANPLWEPGGFTSGGRPEAVINQVPATHFNAYPVI